MSTIQVLFVWTPREGVKIFEEFNLFHELKCYLNHMEMEKDI